MNAMVDFPDWSDLGRPLSEQITNTWDWRLNQLERCRYYYAGDVFEERVELEEPASEADRPLMYPVGINLVRMLCLAQTDAAWGEYQDGELPISFGVRQDQEVTPADQEAIDLAATILEESGGAALLWEHELHRNAFAGGALKVEPALKSPGHVRWKLIPPYAFFPIWDEENPDELLEVYTVVSISPEQARAKWGYESHSDRVKRIEHWSPLEYESFIDEVRIDQFSGLNPWRVVPFVYTPRFRSISWWGDPLAEEIIPTQNELNGRMADIGEAINYNAHPTRWGINLHKNFSAKNYPLGPNAMWDLGRALGSNPKPEVGMLEAQAAIQPGVFEHVKWLYDWTRTSVFAPPIAFGEDNGGGQRSGVTLEIRMWPLIKAVRRSRSYLARSLKRALRISALILSQKRFEDVSPLALKSLLDGRIVPHFADVLPRDHAAAVDEVVKLLSASPPAISLGTAQVVLGRGPGEVERIKADLQDSDFQSLREKAAGTPPGASGRSASRSREGGGSEE